MIEGALASSFRDPGGTVFERDGAIFRQVRRGYAPHYDRLRESGLYDELVDRGLLVAHEEVAGSRHADGDGYVTLRPEKIPFISHPYEWCFGQLQDAARATLLVQETALRFGMTLKDASAYNVQFHGGRPVLIDTLSFESYAEGAPWAGYRQFCRHFLAPLALMARRDVRLGQLLRVHIDGIPLDLARSLIPDRAWFDLQLFLHIRLHAGFERRYANAGATALARTRPIPQRSLRALCAGLRGAVDRMRWKPRDSVWADYYAGDSYDADALAEKKAIVGRWLDQIRPRDLWDLGANTGVFSRLAADRGIRTVSFDADPACVEQSWRDVRERGETRILPLVLDLANPSPAQGWAHAERSSLLDRSPPDAVIALALIHHLAIANHVPLPRLCDFFASLAETLVIEFVPKSDPKVQTLLATRPDVFPDYTEEAFRKAFEAHFQILESAPIRGSERTLHLMRRRATA